LTPTARAALLFAALAPLALVVRPLLAAAAAGGTAVAVVLDALAARARPRVERNAPRVLVRGLPHAFNVIVDDARPVRVRQPLPPDLALQPASEADRALDGELVAARRGLHVLPPTAVRVVGPLGLGAWHHAVGEPADVVVYPDLPAARRLALAVRQGRFRDEARRARGPLGLGTEFESIREYSPDDDIRQVNWLATARLQRPMSNQYRVERDREIVCAIDCGRLMAAPLDGGTRLDAAVDAAVAVAAVAEALGDRCGVIAFDDGVRTEVLPRRAGARAVVEALFDVEPRLVESDYDRAFHRVGEAKRAFVVVLTDLLDAHAARSLLDALPMLARRHAVAVAGAADPDLSAFVAQEPERPLDVYRAAVALDALDARAGVVAQVRRAGAQVVEAPAKRLGAACVSAYLRAKARARL
jgi:uncharacterized protein (DUF58 family)